MGLDIIEVTCFVADGDFKLFVVHSNLTVVSINLGHCIDRKKDT